MKTYRVETSNVGHVEIKAEYFKMIYDGITGVDAHFFVQKLINPEIIGPGVSQEVLVGYVKNPNVVETLDMA